MLSVKKNESLAEFYNLIREQNLLRSAKIIFAQIPNFIISYTLNNQVFCSYKIIKAAFATEFYQ